MNGNTLSGKHTSYVIAKYLRLSIEDEKTDSQSIPHQRMLLDKFIDELDIPNSEILEFVDNGHTGTNMERPAVQELLELVRSGKIQCLVTKDFSRFSRSALDSGYFIEQVFPLYGVRFISVTDNFDSNDYKGDTGGIDVAFKFLMHEYYSQDLSKKIKTAFRARMIRGELIGGPIFGYRKNSDGKWEVDENAAPTVRRIFQMTLDGKSTAEIRDIFNAENIPTPGEYMNKLRRVKGNEGKSLWQTTIILNMLKNPQYMGTYVAGKLERKEIAKNSSNWLPPDSWIYVPGNHPAIVEKAVFEQVQTMLKKSGRKKHGEPRRYLLRGKIKCGCCGYALSLVSGYGVTTPKFRCHSSKADKGAECYGLNVCEADINEAVLAAIRKQAEIILNCADLSEAGKKSEADQVVCGYQKEIAELGEQRQKIYERFVTREISREEYLTLKDGCSARIDRLNRQLDVHRREIETGKANSRAVEFAKKVSSAAVPHAELVDTLIKKVRVFPENRIEIEWNITDFVSGKI